MKYSSLALLMASTSAVQYVNKPIDEDIVIKAPEWWNKDSPNKFGMTPEEIKIDKKLKAEAKAADAAAQKAKQDAPGPLTLQAEAKAKNDAALAKTAKYVEDRREAAEAAKIKANAEYDAKFKERIDAVVAADKASNGTLGVPPLPPLPAPTEYEIIKNSANLTEGATKMRAAMGGMDAGQAPPKEGATPAAAPAAPAEAPKKEEAAAAPAK